MWGVRGDGGSDGRCGEGVTGDGGVTGDVGSEGRWGEGGRWREMEGVKGVRGDGGG